MGKWLTPTVDIRVIGDRNYFTLSTLRYQSDSGKIYETPIGSGTDLGSTWGIPIIATALDGKAQKSCIMHDYHYRTGSIPRKEADKLLRECALAEGQDEETATAFYLGVRIGGASSYKGKEEWND